MSPALLAKMERDLLDYEASLEAPPEHGFEEDPFDDVRFSPEGHVLGERVREARPVRRSRALRRSFR